VKAGGWVVGRRYITAIINLGVMAILARQLTPSQFGIVALARVVMGFLTVVGAGGFGDFVIYDREEGHSQRASSVFWLNLTVTIASCLVAVAILPVAERFYSEPLLKPIVLLLLVQVFFSRLSVVPDALLRRNLDFKPLVLRDGALHVAASAASVAMALAGFGVWSLVVPFVAVSPLRLGVVLVLARWRPTVNPGFRDWLIILNYSGNIMATNIANFLASQGDTLIIGRVLGAGPLGLYNLAWSNANLVSRNLTGLLGRVTMPALSAVATDHDRLVSAFYRMIRLMGMLGFPALLGLLVIAEPFVLTVFGSQWMASVLPMQILILFALRHVIGSPMSVIFKVVGRPDLALKLAMAVIPPYLASVWVGAVTGGIVGVAIGVTVTRTLGGLVSFWAAAHLIGQPVNRGLKELGPSLLATLPMVVLLVLLKIGMLFLGVPHWLELILLVLAGVFCYLSTLRLGFASLTSESIILTSSLSPRLAGAVRWVLAAR
jgi:O-antigen/teichoic acid export membrane protein